MVTRTNACTNLFGDPQYDGRCEFFGDGPTAIPEGLGWFILVGLGAIFACLPTCLLWVDRQFGGFTRNSESFSTAGRNLKVGLTACVIVAKWTWAATLLQSANVAYSFGVSGPFWYAAGATVQVLLFAILAVEIKRKAPTIHTFLEIIRCRWGTTAHIVFVCYGILTNLIVTAMLILGGAAVMEALSGVSVYASSFLIPAGVVIYTAVGGLKGTVMAEWLNVCVIYIALLIFMFQVYATHKDLGSVAMVYQRLRAVEVKHPVADNMGGSYVTMFSKQGFIFGIINIVGNFGTVFVDQSYWQGAIAAKPSATYRGYLLGGLCWFAIPFTFATTMGLGARALDLPITKAEANRGLVPPALAVHLMGKGGAFLMTLQLFMAVTATACAEQMAVATIVAYDIYKPYINRNADGRRMVLMQRITIVAYALFSGLVSVILFRRKVSLSWVYLFMGILGGSAVFPIASSLLWAKCSAAAACVAAVVTTPLAIMTWLITAAKLNNGVLNLETTGQDYPMLAGNLVALFFSMILCVILSYIWPQDFDWAELRNIPVIEFDPNSDPNNFDGEDSPEALNQVVRFTWAVGGSLTLVLLILWPVLALPAKVFSQGYFTFWVMIAIVWGIVASAVCIVLPIIEATDVVVAIWNNKRSSSSTTDSVRAAPKTDMHMLQLAASAPQLQI
ncbi:Urea-proton symporter DUR3 [Tetrabaena socialis]|uniref:Urea-proton symporter DUR3 n=1 Tax=Tetrabaena socialis TaxID=47790 RepID=A0A2J8ABL0_9CHLO|nr:Urea-proton symporter DUR3 [Tetrabaena socialis]|eukprot:PNH09887.1 Urea-proton symporter DUR3 [Tetrabaena socialis]